MPGTIPEIDKLDEFAVPPNQAVCRHSDTFYFTKVRMPGMVQAIKKELLDTVAGVISRRQADAVNHQQGNIRALGTATKIGGGAPPGSGKPAGIT